MQGDDDFAREVKTDIGMYKDVLQGMVGDVYSMSPQLAPRLHNLITRCDGVLAMTTRKGESGQMSREDRREIWAQVTNLRALTESFLTDLSDSVADLGKPEDSYGGAAS